MSEAAVDRCSCASHISDTVAPGQYLGGDRPFGWRIGEDGALIEDEAGQGALAEMDGEGRFCIGGIFKPIDLDCSAMRGMSASELRTERSGC
jgi:hypothetical protein